MKLPEVRDLGSVSTLLPATCAILKTSPVDAGSEYRGAGSEQ